MFRSLRVGIGITAADDPFWLQVQGAIYQHGSRLPVKLIPIHPGFFPGEAHDEYDIILDELVAQELDVLLGCGFPDFLTRLILDKGLPIVHLYETSVVHPRVVSPIGLREIAEKLSHYLASLVKGSGNIIVIGGMLRDDHPDDGRSRIAGIQAAFAEYPGIRFHHIQTDWLNNAEAIVRTDLSNWTQPINAIFGLSDSLALIGREIALEMGYCAADVPVVGINGDPLALAAILEGHMAATVETPAVDLANRAFDIAIRIATDQPYPEHYDFSPRLVTVNNAATVTTQRLSGISKISSYIINYERDVQQDHEDTLKWGAEMSRLIAAVSDIHTLPTQLADIVRARFGFDHGQLYLWSEQDQRLEPAPDGENSAQNRMLSVTQTSLLGNTIAHQKLTFIPDCRRSIRYPPDPSIPETRTRITVPVRHGNHVVGVLDLQAFRLVHCSERRLRGLQSLADQIGVPIHNFRLNQDVARAKAAVEKANRLKTLLLEGIREQLQGSAASRVDGAGSLEMTEGLNSRSKRLRSDAIRLLRLLDNLLEVHSDKTESVMFDYDQAVPRTPILHSPEYPSNDDIEDYALSPHTSSVVKNAIAYVQMHFHERISRAELASTVGVSESYLTQLFRRVTGISLWDYLARYRVHRAKLLLLQTNDSIAEISAQVGFDDPAYFSRVFRRCVGMSPRDYRFSPHP